jgi:hypothetical protein
MAKVTLDPKRHNITNIDLCDNVSYSFNVKNAAIKVVKIAGETFEPANLVNVLNGVSWILQKKDRKIVENYNDARQWQETASYWKVSYKRLKRKAFVLVTLFGAAAAYYAWRIWL